ncbi:MAG: phospholipase/carboxylesterase [Bacteroidetes bacterium HLUCCA01]|nr:MAG: phospholipase/carboxylesterase [Bacteroidetes bacterium HLUCCA01]
MNVLLSGKTSFKVEVPYKLVETGDQGAEKPMIVYLHGRGQNLKSYEKAMQSFNSFSAYHLYIQGPYADSELTSHKKKWGFMWYLYNGKQGSFIKSLEYTAEFIQEIIDHVRQFINVSRLCVIGYSMGGYQAGYFGMTRWKHTNEIIVMAGRYKTEVLTDAKLESMGHQKILAIHGTKDRTVLPEPQIKAVDFLKGHGIDAEIKLVDENHKLSQTYIEAAKDWLKQAGYPTAEK